MSDELTNRLHEYDADWATRFRGKTLTDAAADEITALRARLEAVERERDALAAAKWDVQHTDTMNDMVQMGMARDEATSRAERAEAALVLHQNLDAISVDAVNRLTARAERAEAALATARRDALLEAAKICDCRDREKDDSMYLVGCIDASQANAKLIRALANEASE